MTDDPTNELHAGYAYAPGDSPAYWNFGTYWRLLASSDTTRGRSTTFDELFPEGVVAPPHVHDEAEEAFFVLEGDLVFTLGDDDREITAPPRHLRLHPPGDPALLPLRLHRRPGLQHPGPRRLRSRHHRQRHARTPGADATPGHLRAHGLGADRTGTPARSRARPAVHRRVVVVRHVVVAPITALYCCLPGR